MMELENSYHVTFLLYLFYILIYLETQVSMCYNSLNYSEMNLLKGLWP